VGEIGGDRGSGRHRDNRCSDEGWGAVVIYDLLIQTFRDGDWFMGCLFWVLFGVIAVFMAAGIGFCVNEYRWSKTESFPCSAKLIEANYTGSTRRTHSVPVVTGKGVGIGTVMTGNPEQYITLWDCGRYGRIVADDKNLFRVAQPQMTLLLKKRGGEVRISGWDE
jgi:hypothetical protein